MQANSDELGRAGEILRGDLASLPPLHAFALATRAALRVEPALLPSTPAEPYQARARVRAARAAILTGIAVMAEGPVEPAVPRLAARILGTPDPTLEEWPAAAEPDPSLAAVALAAAATSLEPDRTPLWLARALIAAVGQRGVLLGGSLESGVSAPDTLAAEAAADFRVTQEIGPQGEAVRVLARPLFTIAGERLSETLLRAWAAQLRELELDELAAEYEKVIAGGAPSPQAAAAAVVDWLKTAATAPAVESKVAHRTAPDEQAQQVTPTPQTTPPAPDGRVPLAMFSDEPLADERADVLDFQPYADALAGLVTNPSTATPLTLAINAPWGAGKSTLAKMVRQRLQNTVEDRSGRAHVTCWFDSWAHDDADDLSGAFVATVAQAAAAARPLWRRLLSWVPRALLTPRRRARRHALFAIPALLAIVGVAVAAVSLGLVTTALLPKQAQLPPVGGALVLMSIVALALLVWVTKAASAVGDFVRDPKRVAATGAVTAVRDQLRRLIKQATPGNRRLVAFIDDLERCRPPRPVELLEVVNQLLQHPNVVTVILADMPAVAACVEIKYRDLAERYRPSGTGQPGQLDAGQAYGRLYLQKIVQLQFDVPPPTPDRIRDLVDSLVKRRPAPPPPVPRWRRAEASISKAARAAWEDLPVARVLRARRVRALRREVFLRAQAPGGADADELLRTLVAPEAVTPTLSNVVRESVQRALVGEESEVWKIAEAEARLHVPLLPRNAKRLVNRLRLLIYIAQARHMFAAEREPTARRIGKWAVLCERWPELAQVLAGDPALVGRLEETARSHPLGSDVFTGLMKQVAPVHAKDDALQPFCMSEPQLQPILEDLLHLQPAAPAGAQAGAPAAGQTKAPGDGQAPADATGTTRLAPQSSETPTADAARTGPGGGVLSRG